MTTRARTTIAAIATALIAAGGLPPAQAVQSEGSDAPARVAPQTDERRAECVREKNISGLPVRSLLCFRVVWDASEGTTTLVAKLRIANATKTNRSMRIWLSTHHGAFKGDDRHDYGMAPGGTVTYTERRRVPRYLDHPVAKSRVFLYSGETDDYTIRGKTLRAAP